MSSRARAAAALAAALVVGAAGAQVEEGALSAVDPWGVGFLERGEPAMPTGMWTASRAEDLAPLMAKVRTKGLTPAERTLLRRVMLSPAAPPKGEAASDLLARRARILYELGEAEAAATLYAQIGEEDADGGDGLAPAERAVDLQLALGAEASACANAATTRDGPFWLKLRAVCAALRGQTAEAELAVELAQAQGVADPWLFSAVFAASGELPDKPPARYDSGVDLALSLKGGLEAPRNAVTAMRADLAAAMAAHEGVAPPLRIVAAGLSAEAGLIDAKTHRVAYEALIGQEGFRPSNPVEVALIAGAEGPGRAAALAAALKAAGAHPARHAAVARLLSEDIADAKTADDAARHAPVFARAALATGDLDAASAWRLAAEAEGAPDPDLFELAELDALILLAGGEDSRATVDAVGARLAEAAESRDEARAAGRLFALWSAFGHALPVEARSLIARQSGRDGRSMSAWDETRLAAAADAGAAGEVVIATLAATKGDPGRLGPSELRAFILALREIGADDAARGLALESTNFWRD